MAFAVEGRKIRRVVHLCPEMERETSQRLDTIQDQSRRMQSDYHSTVELKDVRRLHVTNASVADSC